jgi:hypothetical protein
MMRRNLRYRIERLEEAWHRAPSDVVGTAVGTGAVLLTFAVAVCGLFGPIPEGHYASSGAIGMAAQNMWRWHTTLPLIGYASHPGTNYYMHHPLGVFWVIAALGKVLGFNDIVLRLPTIVYATGTTFLTYRLGRDLWGAVAGGIAALAFVALPITLGFANYHDLEQPVMFGCLVSTWAYVRFVRTWRDRYAWLSVAGFLFALANDWPAYVWGAFFLFGLFVRGMVLGERPFGPVDARRFGRYWALMVGAVVISLAIEATMISASGRLNDVLGSYSSRASGSSTPLRQVLAARAYRIELMFTGLGILLGKLAVPVIAARAVLRRNDLELLPLPILFASILQYVLFKQGADVHIFWPHMFALYFGLAAGALAASVHDVAAWLGRRLTGRRGAWLTHSARWAPFLLVGLPTALVLKDGLSLVRLARESGGRFAEANLESGIDKQVALDWFLARTPPQTEVGFHSSVFASWAIQWELRPRSVAIKQPVEAAAPRVYILDPRTAPLADLRKAAARFHVHVVGTSWLVDRGAPAAPLDAYAVDEAEPSLLRAWLWGPTEPVRSIRWDPWLTWEARTLVGQPASSPSEAPTTTEQVRVAHNEAISRGDAVAAAGLRASLERRFTLPLQARYDNGTRLIGAVVIRGAQPSITLYFVAGSFAADAHFVVRAKVVAPPRLSTLPADPDELELQGGALWPATLWREGEIHTARFVYRRRPGRERFTGAWAGAPRRADATGPVEIPVP